MLGKWMGCCSPCWFIPHVVSTALLSDMSPAQRCIHHSATHYIHANAHDLQQASSCKTLQGWYGQHNKTVLPMHYLEQLSWSLIHQLATKPTLLALTCIAQRHPGPTSAHPSVSTRLPSADVIPTNSPVVGFAGCQPPPPHFQSTSMYAYITAKKINCHASATWDWCQPWMCHFTSSCCPTPAVFYTAKKQRVQTQRASYQICDKTCPAQQNI